MRRALLHFQRYKSVAVRVFAGPDRREVAPAEFLYHSISSVKNISNSNRMVAARPIPLRALSIQFADVGSRSRRRRRRRVVVVVGIIQIVARIDVVLGRVRDGLGRLLRLLARGRLGGRGLAVFSSSPFPRHRISWRALSLAFFYLAAAVAPAARRARTSGLTVLAVSLVVPTTLVCLLGRCDASERLARFPNELRETY